MYCLEEKSPKKFLSSQRNQELSITFDYFDIDKKELKNDIKNSSSLRLNNEEIPLKSNSFRSINSNTNKNNIDLHNKYFILESPQYYINNFETVGNNTKLLNYFYETQIEKRLDELKSITKNSPVLSLNVLSSNYYKKGKLFKIDPLGIINENKGKNYINKNNNHSHKGIVYFGYCPDKSNKIYKKNKYKNSEEKKNTIKNKENNDNINIDIDIQVPPWDKENDKEKILNLYSILNKNNTHINEYLEDKQYGIYFYIYFNPDYMKYYIKDFGIHFCTFIKIQNEIILKSNNIINIGDTFLFISIGIEKSSLNLTEEKLQEKKKIFSFTDTDYNNNLHLKIFSKEKNYAPMNFLPTKSKIKIGRSLNCEIIIEDIQLSRIHCTIEYKNNLGWIIRDGYNNKENVEESSDNKGSTNGTWIYTLEDTAIYEGMILRSDNNIFRCQF